METISVELFTDQGNFAILKLPERKFPGVVVQGDSLSILCNDVQKIHERARETGEEDLIEMVQFLKQDLDGIRGHYEAVLKVNGIELPYLRPER